MDKTKWSRVLELSADRNRIDPEVIIKYALDMPVELSRTDLENILFKFNVTGIDKLWLIRQFYKCTLDEARIILNSIHSVHGMERSLETQEEFERLTRNSHYGR